MVGIAIITDPFKNIKNPEDSNLMAILHQWKHM